MMRVRCDGGALTNGRAADARRDLDRVRPRHRRHQRPRERPVPLDRDRGRPGDLGAARRGRPADHRGVRRLPPRGAGLAAGRRVARRGNRRDPAIEEIVRPLHRQPGVLQPAAQVQDRDLGAAGRRATRSTTSRSSASTIPSTVPASTCGSAAACPPTQCWASGSAHGCRWRRCPTSGRPWSAVFRDYGYRRLRAKARLKFLIKDWGIEKFREVLEDRNTWGAS